MNGCKLSFNQLISMKNMVRQGLCLLCLSCFIFIIYSLDLYYSYYHISMTGNRLGFAEEIKFIRIEGTDIFVISAFVDYRIKPHPDIKIFGLAPLGEYNVWCRFNKAIQVRAQINIYKEFVAPFGQWKTTKMTCAVPISVQNLTNVGIYANNNHSNTEIQYIKLRKVGNLCKKHSNSTIGICMKTLFNYHTQQDVYSIIEYMELQKIFGYSKVFLYGMSNYSKEVKAVIEYYQKEGFVDFQPWNLPVPSVNKANTNIDKKSIFSSHDSHKPASVRNFAQILAHYDCLYRHMDEYSFLAYIDIDEFIIPSASIPLQSYLEYLSKKHNRTASFKFDGYIFCDTVPEWFNDGGKLVRKTDSKMYLPHPPSQPKSIVIPKYVLDSHVHIVMDSVKGVTREITIDTKEAKLYHFRKGHKCDRVANAKLDLTFQRYHIHLSNAMNIVINNLKLS